MCNAALGKREAPEAERQTSDGPNAVCLVLRGTIAVAVRLIHAETKAVVVSVVVGHACRALRTVDISVAPGKPAVATRELGQALELDIVRGASVQAKGRNWLSGDPSSTLVKAS